MIFLARIPIVFLTLGLALTAFRFAENLWGQQAGLIAYLLLLFDPNILAHGRYSTTDLGGSLFLFLAAFLLWRWWHSQSGGVDRAILAGIGLGLAYSSKLSALAFAPIFGLLSLLPLFSGSWHWRSALRRFTQFSVMNLLALLVVWASFGFQWGPLQFADPSLSFLNNVAAPMPTFWAGIEQILFISEGGRPAFLLGETSTDGFPAYFPVAFIVKTPLPTLLLLAIALVVLYKASDAKSDRQKATYLLLPAILFFLASIPSGLNIGYRHLLPILPFIYLVIAGGVAHIIQRRSEGAQSWRYLLPPAVALGLILLLINSTVLIHPHYLSYFNALSGGPDDGYKILVDSNVDWGQDLLRLREWMEENDVTGVHLSWFGTADPLYYGIEYDPLPGLPRHFNLWWDVPFDPANPRPGVYAISVSNLWELPLQNDKYVFPWFRNRPPDDRVAHSILIYEVE